MQIGIQTAGLAIWRHHATVEEDVDEWDVSTLEDTEREDAL